MARLKREFETKSSAEDMRAFIDEKILDRKELKPFFSLTTWQGDSLYFESRFCSGSIALRDQRIEIDLELTLFGRLFRKKLDSALERNFGLLAESSQSDLGNEKQG